MTRTTEHPPVSANTNAPAGGAWRLDPERSSIGFGVRKMGLYTVKGRFRTASGELFADPGGTPLAAEITIEAARVSRPPRVRPLNRLEAEHCLIGRTPTERIRP